MTIKSDRWIRSQCMPPTFVITREGPMDDPVHNPHQNDSVMSWDSSEKIEAEFLRLYNRYNCSSYSYRPLTDEEKAKYPQMITPFEPAQVRSRAVSGYEARLLPGARQDPEGGFHAQERVLSYGTSSYGYDIRAAREFRVFTNINSTIVDPKNFDPKSFVDVRGDYCIIPPNSFALARSVEYFRIPRDVLVICLGKSTYARVGLVVGVTPLEPEWEGYLTLEFSNTTPLPAKIYANEGVAQLLFFQSDEPCLVSYKDRGGKYQGQQAEPVTPTV